MTGMSALWLPILLSAVAVFVASSVIHMMLPWHKTDFAKVPDEEKFRQTVGGLAIPPGDYCVPHPGSHEAMRKPEFVEKMKQGPIVLMTVAPGSAPSMTGPLVLWFLYSILVSAFAGYIAGSALAPGTHYLAVFRVVGTAAFMGYSFALLQHSIWYKRNWGTTLKSVFDGLVYGLLTAGVFGWLWPR